MRAVIGQSLKKHHETERMQQDAMKTFIGEHSEGQPSEQQTDAHELLIALTKMAIADQFNAQAAELGEAHQSLKDDMKTFMGEHSERQYELYMQRSGEHADAQILRMSLMGRLHKDEMRAF